MTDKIIREIKEILLQFFELQAEDNNLKGYTKGDFLTQRMSFAYSEYSQMNGQQLETYLMYIKMKLDKKYQLKSSFFGSEINKEIEKNEFESNSNPFIRYQKN